MALTKEEIEIMDNIAFGGNSAKYKNQENLTPLTAEEIAEMDRITGFSKYNEPETEAAGSDLREQIINEDKERSDEWLKKGAIEPFEAVQNTARYFNGTYNNIDNSANLTALGKRAKNSSLNQEADDRLERIRQKKLERNKKVNEGTANIIERASAALDRWGRAAYETNKKAAQERFEENERMQGVNRLDKTKRYEIRGYNPSGLPMYREIDLIDKIGFLEASRKSIYEGTAIGSAAEALDAQKEQKILKKIYNNESIRQDELNFVNRRIEEEKEKIIRGYSAGGQIGEGLGKSLGITFDMLTGSAVFRALGGAGLAASAAAKAETAVKGVNALSKTAPLIGLSAKAGVTALGGGAVNTLISPWRTYEEFQGRMRNQQMKITDTGISIFKDAEEKPAEAFFKSLEKTYIMYAVEMGLGSILRNTAAAGGILARQSIAPVTSKLFQKFPKLEKLINRTMTEFSKRYEKLNNLPVIGKSTGWMKDKAHFDGFLEEMGEEALEDVLNRLIGTENKERTLKGYAEDIFKSPDEWLVIAGCIALQGGMFSAADFVLGNSMAQRGAGADEIQEVLENASAEQKSEFIDELIKKEDIKLILDDSIVNKSNISKAEDIIAKQYIDAGQDKTTAEDYAKLQSVMLAGIAEAEEREIEEAAKDYIPSIENIKGYAYTDGAGRGFMPENIEKRLDDLSKQFEALEDNAPEETVQKLLNDMQILENLKNGILKDEENERAFELLSASDENSSALEAEKTAHFQSAENQSAVRKIKQLQRSDNSAADVKYYDNSDVKNIKAFNIRKLKFNNFQNVKDIKKNDIKKAVLHDKEKIYAVNKKSNIKAGITGRNLKKIISSVFTKNKNNKYARLEKEIIANAPVIFENAVPILEHPEVKKKNEKLFDKQIVHRFALPVQIGGTDFMTIITVKQRIDFQEAHIDEFAVYDMSSQKISGRSSMSEVQRTGQSRSRISNYTINDLTEFVNSNIAKYEYKNSSSILFQSENNGIDINSFLQDREKNNAEKSGISAQPEDEFKPAHEYDYINHRETGEKITLELNPELEQRKNELVKPLIINKADIQFKSGKKSDVSKAIKEKLFEYKNKKLIPVNAVNKHTGVNALINAASVEESAKELLSKTDKNLIASLLINSKNIFETSEYIFSNDEAKNTNLIGKQKIHRYANVINYENENYIVISTLKENTEKKTNTQKPEFKIYHLTGYKSGIEKRNQNTSVSNTADISISQLRDFVKSRIVENYNTDYQNSYLKYSNEQETSRNKSVVTNEINELKYKLSKTENEEQKKLLDEQITELENYLETGEISDTVQEFLNIRNNDYIGENKQNELFSPMQKKLYRVKGAFLTGHNFIKHFEGKDRSTILHETAHWYLDILTKSAKHNPKIADKLEAVRKFLKNNGEEFTFDQHEKFARSFEAYIRSGNARSSRLKQVFEDFKNFLMQIYDGIKSLGVTEEEMPEINALFDDLLSAENERIKAAVFDRCDILQEQINNLKNKQEQEFKELEEIEQRSLKNIMQKKELNAQVQKYLALAEKASERVPASVKEERKRYKDVTFQILEAASGYDRRFIANPKNWEKVQKAIDNADDKITAGNGFAPEWGEFYTDTGVSYENQETGADYKLASQAFKVLQEGSFEFGGTDDKAIGRFFGMFDYLSGKVLSENGQKKEHAFQALSSLFENMPSMPDEAVLEIAGKFNDIQDSYADERLKGYQDFEKRENIPLHTELQVYILHKLNEMKSYDPDAKRIIRLSSVNRLYKLVRNINTVYMAKDAVREINNFAVNEIENKMRSILHKEIQKQITINSKLIKSDNIKKGRFDWRHNKIFAELLELNKKSIDEITQDFIKMTGADTSAANEEAAEREDKPQNEFMPAASQAEKIKRKFIEYRSSRVKDLNISLTRSLLEDILKLKFEGRKAKSDAEFEKALERHNEALDIAEKITQNLKNKNGLSRFLARWTLGQTMFTSEGTLANWESSIAAVTDLETARKFSLLKLEADVDVMIFNKTRELYGIAKKVYKLGNHQNLWNKITDANDINEVLKHFSTYEDEAVSVLVKTYDKHSDEYTQKPAELTRNDIMMLFGWYQNKQLKDRIINMFGEEQCRYIFSQISDEDMEFMKQCIDFCDSFYEDMNEVYISIYGVSLPKNENYLPSKTERIGSDLDMFHERFTRSNLPSSIKTRKVCSKIKMAYASPFEILLPHIQKNARFILLSEKLNEMQKIWESPLVKAALNDAFSNSNLSIDFPSNYDYVYNQKTGNKIKLKLNMQIKNEIIKPQIIDGIIPFNLSEKPSDNRKKVIQALGLKDLTVQIQNNNTNQLVNIDAGTIEKSISNVKRNDAHYSDFISMLMNIQTLFENSELILSHYDIETDTQDKINRYANIADVNGRKYLLEFIVKDKESVKLYSVNALDNTKAAPAKRLISGSRHSAPDTADFSIAHIQTLFKSKLAANYNKDYTESIKRIKEAENKKKTLLDKFKKKRKDLTGEKIHKVIMNQLASSAFTNYAKTLNYNFSLLDTAARNKIAASIGLSPKIVLTQLISVINYAENMPSGEWALRFKENALHPKETIKYMLENIPYLEARFKGNSMNEIMQALTNDFDKWRILRNFSTANVRYGDILAIIFGGKPYVDYLIEQGIKDNQNRKPENRKTEEQIKKEAFTRFIEDTLRAQQAGVSSSTSMWQKAQVQHPFTWLFTSFRNTEIQYERKWADALTEYSKGNMKLKQLAKTFAIYKVFNPVLFTHVISNLGISYLLRWIIDGDDDEGRTWGQDLLSALMLGGWKAYGYAGTILYHAIDAVRAKIQKNKYFSVDIPIYQDFEHLVRGYMNGITIEDYIDTFALGMEYSTGFAGTKAVNIGEGIYDMTQDRAARGALRTAGWGKYKANIAVTGRPPRRNE